MNHSEGLSKNSKLKIWTKVIFYVHLLIYVVVNAFLAFVNIYTGVDYLWFLWVVFSWGMGIIFHLGVSLVIFYVYKKSTNNS